MVLLRSMVSVPLLDGFHFHGSIIIRDDVIRFTDLCSLEEKFVMKLEDQPITIRSSGSTVVVICTSYV